MRSEVAQTPGKKIVNDWGGVCGTTITVANSPTRWRVCVLVPLVVMSRRAAVSLLGLLFVFPSLFPLLFLLLLPDWFALYFLLLPALYNLVPARSFSRKSRPGGKIVEQSLAAKFRFEFPFALETCSHRKGGA